MREAIPDCIVSGYENPIDGLALPDPDDRHVLAAAVRSGAQTIVTFNLKDFPAATLDGFGVEARHPDDFLVDQIGLAPGLAEPAKFFECCRLTCEGLARGRRGRYSCQQQTRRASAARHALSRRVFTFVGGRGR